jgi:hypothetical protein
MKLKNQIGILFGMSFVFFNSVVLADTIIKDETTPPVAEGPLTVEQIPPLTNIGKLQPPEQKTPAASPSTDEPGK